MGLFQKIKGLTGIPDWTSGTVKTLVIDNDGELFTKNTSGGNSDGWTEKACEGGGFVTTPGTVTPTDFTYLDLEANTLYEMEFIGRCLVDDTALSNDLLTEWHYTGTVDYVSLMNMKDNNFSVGLVETITVKGGFFSSGVYLLSITRGIIKTNTSGRLKLYIGVATGHDVYLDNNNIIRVRKIVQY